MKSDVGSSGSDGGGSGEREQGESNLHETTQDEFHEGRNWAVIVILFAILLALSLGLALLIWFLF
jgi:hypothetical protein